MENVEYHIETHSGFISEEELRSKDNEKTAEWLRSIKPDGIIIPTGDRDPVTDIPIFKTVMFDKKT